MPILYRLCIIKTPCNEKGLQALSTEPSFILIDLLRQNTFVHLDEREY